MMEAAAAVAARGLLKSSREQLRWEKVEKIKVVRS
jgi:hypothetical protein